MGRDVYRVLVSVELMVEDWSEEGARDLAGDCVANAGFRVVSTRVEEEGDDVSDG